MKRNTIFILLLIIQYLFISCTPPSSNDHILQEADSLIEVNPEKSLDLLRSIKAPSKMNEKELAKYALLLTQAIDKCYLPHTSDSLIMIAVNFFKKKSNNNQKAKSYFYLGRVQQKNNNILEAIEAYLHAIESLPSDNKLQVLIYDNLGACHGFFI